MLTILRFATEPTGTVVSGADDFGLVRGPRIAARQVNRSPVASNKPPAKTILPCGS
jgi:hypothetical protein